MNLLGFFKGVWGWRLKKAWMLQKKLHHCKPSPVMGDDLWKLAGECLPSNSYCLSHLGMAVGILKNLKLPKTCEFC